MERNHGRSDSAADMERIQRGLEDFLQQEMAQESGRAQRGPQIFTLSREQESEREIDIIGSTGRRGSNQSTRREIYVEDWDSRTKPTGRRTGGSGRTSSQSRQSSSRQGSARNSRQAGPQGGRQRQQDSRQAGSQGGRQRQQDSRQTGSQGGRQRQQDSRQRRQQEDRRVVQSRGRYRQEYEYEEEPEYEETRPRRAKKSKAPRRKKKKSRLKGFLIKAVLVFLLLAAGLYFLVGSVYSKLNYYEIESVASESMMEEGVVNILLIGNDSRKNSVDGRSDAMILLSVSNKAKRIYMTSLLRDMYVDIPGHDGNRLNAAYSYGGAELLMDTVEQNLDIRVNRCVIVNFEAFANLVDAVGGVDLELTSAELELVNGYLNEYNELTGKEFGTDYMDTAAEGMVHLNGPQALAYTRNRYIGTDFGRTERQRKVLAEVIHKLPLAVILHPKKLFDGLMPNLTTNLTQWECYRLSLMAPKLFLYDMEQSSIPLDGTYKNASIRGMDVLEVDFDANKEYLRKKLFEPQETEETQEPEG